MPCSRAAVSSVALVAHHQALLGALAGLAEDFGVMRAGLGLQVVEFS